MMHLAHGANGALPHVAALAAMWFAMMAVMMAPVAWPWAVAFNRFNVTASPSTRAAATLLFVSGYAAAWLVYSVVAALLQRGLGTATAPAPALAAVVLIAAGLMQFSSLKRACLIHCRNPLSYLLSCWRNGPMPPWRIGFGHGIYCVGCCWALMATMLVVGVSNVWWMAGLAAAALVEQMARQGDIARMAIGIALVGAGVIEIL